MSLTQKIIRIHKYGGIDIELPWKIDTPTTWLSINIVDRKTGVETCYFLEPKNKTVKLVLKRIP